MNKKVIDIINKTIKPIVPDMIDNVCEELSEYDDLDKDTVYAHLEEFSNYYGCEEFFLEAYDKVAKRDGINIEEEDSVAYVWDNYEEEIVSIFNDMTNQAYSRLTTF